MFKKLINHGRSKKDPENFTDVIKDLKHIYTENISKLENYYRFNQFYSPILSDGDFFSKPTITVMGQYSTGKTSLIRHLLGKDYPGSRIGPEPTTDKFVAIMYGETDQIIPGNAAVSDSSKPLSQLSVFGNNFLSKFEVITMNNSILKCVTLIDTPGILSGSKKTLRGYDFEEVIRWISDQSHLILILFDSFKLDISDELIKCISVLRNNDSKIRIILNKADSVPNQQLMRIYGALMWSLGKVISTPEVARVYIGSFWDMPLRNTENQKLFEAEALDLYNDFKSLPRNSVLQKLNDFVKRLRLLKVHMFLLEYIRKNIPLFGKQNKKKQLINELDRVYVAVSQLNHISLGDFPEVLTFKEKLMEMDWSKIPKMDSKHLKIIDDTLAFKIPKLMQLAHDDEKKVLSDFEDQIGFNVLMGEKTTCLVELDDTTPKSSSSMVQLLPRQRMQKMFLNSDVDIESLRSEYEERSPSNTIKGEMVKYNTASSTIDKIWSLDRLPPNAAELDHYALVRSIMTNYESIHLP